MSSRPVHVVRVAWITLALVFAASVCVTTGQDLTAEDVLNRARDAWQGESFYAMVTLDLTLQDQTKHFRFEIWTLGSDKALLRFHEPEEEADAGYLQLGDELWYYSPLVGSAIKLPAMALAEAVLGSGPSLEDLFHGTLSEDYDATMTHEDSGYLLTLVPHPDAPVVYGKLEIRVREDFALEEIVYYDQRDQVLSTATFSDYLDLDGRVVPTQIVVEEASGNRTVERLEDPQFGIELDPALFTVETLENP